MEAKEIDKYLLLRLEPFSIKSPVQMILLEEKIEPFTINLWELEGLVPIPILQLIILTSRDKYLFSNKRPFSVILPLQIILPVIIGLTLER